MKISFHGAARAVTGSKHLIELPDRRKVLLDCGLFQGMGKDTDRLNRQFGFDPAAVDALLLSHAHIDHCGLIPRLVAEGFRGKIWCTPATRALAEVLLLDSAKIQEDEIRYVNKRRKAQGLHLLKPLYSAEEANACAVLFEVAEYDHWVEVLPNVHVQFTDAGHIIGSAAIHVRYREGSNERQLTFSGDVGRYGDAILRSPASFSQADVLIIESTYGNSLHPLHVTTPDLLLRHIEETCLQRKGKLIIAAFSVGRTQELLYFLNQLEVENRLPAVPVYLDSPLSVQATEIVKSFPSNFNKTIQDVMRGDADPFGFSQLKFVRTVEQSKQLNFENGPMVIIAASGMADAGRIKHHISNAVENSRNRILFTGYCEPRSLGGRLLSGQKEVSIYGVSHEVHASIDQLRSMSAHGDYEDLCQWLACQQPNRVKGVFLVHGNYEVQLDFRRRLLNKGFTSVAIPDMHEVVEVL
ncbi:MAG: MBL fold metallo-hydrolase RNA specificity domain-containing protein [Sphingomonadales bacterium]